MSGLKVYCPFCGSWSPHDGGGCRKCGKPLLRVVADVFLSWWEGR